MRALLLADFAGLVERARATGFPVESLVSVETPEEGFSLPAGTLGVLSPHAPLRAKERRPGVPSPAGGAAALSFVDAGCDLVSTGLASALVTGPVSKAEIASSDAPRAKRFLGHTEHLMRRLRAPSVTMAFWSKRFTSSLVTTHLSIRDVPRHITRAAVLRATLHTARFLASVSDRTKELRLVVSGLNPHAGEDGLLGREEIERIAPAIADARAELSNENIAVRIDGPMPAESALRLAHEGVYAGVVTMFHDQATIAMKLTGFGEAVNVSLGLPIIRTSVDHGTAFDRAGSGTADARGMLEAVGLAIRMSRARSRT